MINIMLEYYATCIYQSFVVIYARPFGRSITGPYNTYRNENCGQISNPPPQRRTPMEFENLIEKTINRNVMFEGRIITVCKNDVLLPNGKTGTREIVEHNGGVCIAPITDKKELIFVRQFRSPYSEVILELPAGKLEKGEDPFEAGKRELEEETGKNADNYRDMGKFYPTPGYCGEIIHLYAAWNLKDSKMHLDDDEFLEPILIPIEKAVEMVMNNEIRDGKTQTLILKINELIRKGELL